MHFTELVEVAVGWVGALQCAGSPAVTCAALLEGFPVVNPLHSGPVVLMPDTAVTEGRPGDRPSTEDILLCQ